MAICNFRAIRKKINKNRQVIARAKYLGCSLELVRVIQGLEEKIKDLKESRQIFINSFSKE